MSHLAANRPTPRPGAHIRMTVCAVAGWLVAVPCLLAGMQPAHAQAVYSSPEAASAALTDALATNDTSKLEHVLGRDFREFIPASEIGQDDIYEFLSAWAEGHSIVDSPKPIDGHPAAHLSVGTDGWTLPIPIVKRGAGWNFDPRAGSDELLTRRIGRNELATMMTSLAYIDAQNDYHDQMQHYAQHLVSTPGKRDGLYWDAGPDEPQSPLGPLAEVMPRTHVRGQGYYGYHYRILTAQGSHASGGARSYLDNGTLSSGFGLVAWPVEYGKSGVMTFIVNQDGQIYEKDLGPDTPREAAAVHAFDPDPSWKPTQP